MKLNPGQDARNKISGLAVIFVVIVMVLCTRNCAALDWKVLHEQADYITLTEAADALQKGQETVDALYVFGLLKLYNHEDKEAEAIFSRIIELQPDCYEALWGVAEALRRQHHLDKSARMLDTIIKEHPDFSPAYISLAYIKYLQMSFDDGVRLAGTVLKRGPDASDKSNYMLAHCLYAGNKGMIAYYGGLLSKIINGVSVLGHLKQAEKLLPENIAVYYGLGSYYLLSPPGLGRDLQKAAEFLDKAIKKDPLFVQAYARRAQVFRLQGDNESYDKYIAKALDIDPQDEIALDIKNNTCKFICVGKKK
ncbi:MAG: tetratricopeptide repeat protein [Candidatus Omnitrophica bacterium]|nr:tetratricopeptide repeat protein [Candidatus Omnitrophota bacterium]